MAHGDLTRIRSNIQGLAVLAALRDVNNQVGIHQLRLATGKRINTAGDDPAGLTIATKLESHNQILKQIYNNLRSVGLSRVVGYQTPNNTTIDWLRAWGKVVGREGIEKMLKAQGAEDVAKYSRVLEKL